MNSSPPTTPTAPRLVGQPVRRKEDRRLLTGAGRYLDDLQLPGTLHLAFVRSPHPHARIMTVDASAALHLPGVVAVLAGAEAAALAGPIQAVRQVPAYHETRAPLIARDRVLFVGQIVAAVIARSCALAEDAADLVSVAYEPLAPVLDPRAAMAEGALPLHPDLPSNVVWAGNFQVGDIDQVLRDGSVQAVGTPGRSVSLADIGRLAHVTPYFLPPEVEPGLQVTRYYDPLDITFSNGAHLAAVEVDIETGGAQLRRYVVVEDCGTVINPAIVDGQVLGGLCNGVGEALFEERLYDGQGQLLVTSLLDYPLPRAADMPRVHIEHLCSPSPKTVLGIKGVGESGIIPAGAAIANALADAVDPWRCRIRQLPVTAERLWRAAQEAREP